MEQKFDKLGRVIPVFDRSAAAVKANKTNKEKYGTDYHKRIGTDGGSKRTRGHFGRLKDEGKTAELKKLSRKGNAKATKYFKTLSIEDPEKLREISARHKTKKKQGDAPVSGGR